MRPALLPAGDARASTRAGSRGWEGKGRDALGVLIATGCSPGSPDSVSVGASQGSEEEEKQLEETFSACRGVGHAHIGEKTLRVTLQPPLPRQKAKASSRDAGGGWERGSQRPRQSIAEIRGRNCLSRGCAAPNTAGLPLLPTAPTTDRKSGLIQALYF